jgi:hypothetical protein
MSETEPEYGPLRIPVDVAALIERGRELLYIDPMLWPKPRNYRSITEER